MTLEAMALLALARFLVARVALHRWRWMLGQSLDSATPLLGPALVATGTARRIGAATERGTYRLGGEVKCLPKAICAHWMLRRRGYRSVLVLAALLRNTRSPADELHAWAETDLGVVIGESRLPYRPVSRFGRPDSVSRG